MINIPHPRSAAAFPMNRLPPLGLLAIGVSLINDGHECA
jgi:anaerobic magnesium-protoporphyrin IX monomethyl ester cyclase